MKSNSESILVAQTPRNFLLLVILLSSVFLQTSIARASWPTELYSGKPIAVDTTADEEAVDVVQAPDGSLRLLTRNWRYNPSSYYFGLEYSLYAMNSSGNLLWEPSEELKYFIERVLDPYTYYPVIMKVGRHGETWIVWESYVNSIAEYSSLYPSNNSIRAVRFDADGHQTTPQSFIAAAQGPRNMKLHPRHVEVLDDGGMILLWEVDRNLGDGEIPYEVRAQKFDSTGNEIWATGGSILNSTYNYYERRYTSGPAVSDGAGGLLLALGNEFQRLNANGYLAWNRGNLVEATMDSNDRTTMMEIEPGRSLVIGLNERPNLVNASSSIITEYDSSGNRSQVVVQLQDQKIVTFGPVKVDDEYFAFFGNSCLIRFSSEFIATTYDIRNGFTEDGAFTGRGSINKDGLRIEYHVDNTTHVYRIAAFDPSFNLAWKHQISPDETTHSYQSLPWLANDGTTFLFWSEPGLKAGKRDIYANVVNLAGDWGVLETSSAPERTIVPLPSQITLRAWPNPTNSRIRFNTTFERPTRVFLYTITGREVWHGTLQPGDNGTIPLSNFPSGPYLLTLPDAGVSQRVTLIK